MTVKLISKKKRGRFKEAAEEKLELKIPTELSVPSDSLQDYSILIYGKKKIGKTTLAAQFEGALFLMCEPGGKALRIRQVPIKSWQEFKGYVELAVADDSVRTVVIDTGDYSYDYCMDYVCDRDGMVHPSDEAYGKGWKAVKKEYTKYIAMLLHSGKGVIILSHSQDREFKARNAEAYSKVVSSMSGQARDVLEGLVDIWANYDYDGKRRVLTIVGSDEVDAGHRIEGRFKYPNGEPIASIPMGRSPQEGYRNFVAAFNNRSSGEKTVGVLRKKGGKLFIKR